MAHKEECILGKLQTTLGHQSRDYCKMHITRMYFSSTGSIVHSSVVTTLQIQSASKFKCTVRAS